ncbi:MAG: hypothetical protein MUF31_06130 [Akkermansiaceae bacterium]|nr:hypothetical protein [Akkermansiaceae bacterium]
MKPLTVRAALIAAAALSAAPVSAEVLFQFTSAKDYVQLGSFTTAFRGGVLNVNVRDGNAILSPCPHPSPVVIQPNLLCPLGTTGFIADGDVDNDGIRDDLSFWSLSDVIPAFLIEPFQPGRCLLSSAPPSDLPRPLGPFLDEGAVMFYNVLTATVLQYNISWYDFNRIYPGGPAGRAQMNDEIVLGDYIFTFPQINTTNRVLPIGVRHYPTPEAIDPANRYPLLGFRFTGGTWDAAGNRLLDPYLTSSITWTGNDATNTFPAVDQVRLSIRDNLPPVNVGDPASNVTFPPSATPLLLPNPLTQQYNIPPFFYAPGDVGFFQFRLDRALGTTAIAFDTAVRLFHFPIRFVKSYEGFRIIDFPVGTNTTQSAPANDFDGDGQSNVLEFAMGTNPNNAGSVSAAPVAVQNLDGTVSFTVTKQANIALNYRFAVSFLGGPLTPIAPGNAVWAITEDSNTTYTITTLAPALAADFTAVVSPTVLTL